MNRGPILFLNGVSSSTGIRGVGGFAHRRVYGGEPAARPEMGRQLTEKP